MKRIASWLKKYFIPHEGNDHKPHFFRHESMLLTLLVIIIVELGFLAQVYIVLDKTKFLAAVLPGVLTALANEERAGNNLAPLTESELLRRAAQLKAEDMARNGYFAHTSPGGLTPWHWLDQVGYRYSMAGENLAINFSESIDVEQAWMNSPTHRDNIMKANYTEIGIAVAKGEYEGRNTVFVAQFFGTPIKKSAPIESTPPPVAPTPTPAPSIPETPAIAVATPTPVTQAPEIQVLGEEQIPVPTVSTEKSVGQAMKISLEKTLTSPHQSINYFYLGAGIFIILALCLTIFIKHEIQHPAIIGRGVALVAVIIFLFYLNVKVIHVETMVPPPGLSANVIVAY